MICKCGANAKQHNITRKGETFTFWECPACGRELAEGEARDAMNEKFQWSRVGWYQDTLKPLPFLTTPERMYDCCLLRVPNKAFSTIPRSQKYLHGLIRADGTMITTTYRRRHQ